MLAAVFMMGSILSFTLMAIAARQIGGRHDTFEIMTARSAIGLVLVLIVAAALGRLSDISTTRLPGHLLRNIVHFTGQNLWFLALTLAPLAQVFALDDESGRHRVSPLRSAVGSGGKVEARHDRPSPTIKVSRFTGWS